MMDLSERAWVKHTVFHPFEGFEDLRWKKAGSLLFANIVIVLWFIGAVLCENFYGKQFVIVNIDEFSVVPFIIRTIVLFLAGVISNWAVCTLLDGEGNVRRIYIYSAYALIPYVAQLYIQTALSHILIRDEEVFLIIVEAVGTLWSGLLIFMAIKTVHQFSVSKTIWSLLLTIAGMLIILLLLVLMISLFQQIYAFIAEIYTELEYRLRA